jgi:hypothetical protein
MTPVLFFWDKPERPAAKVLGPDEPSRLVFDGSLRGSRFVVTLGGYVATEKLDRREAADDVDAFALAVTLLRGHAMDPIGDDDLDVCDIPQGTSTVQLKQGKLSRLGSAYSLYPEFLITVSEEWPVLSVTDAAILPEVVILAESLASSPYKVAHSQVLRAFSAQIDGEAITGFLSAWIVVEMFVATELRLFMAAKGTPDEVISESLRSWPIGTKIGLLKRWKVLKPLTPDDPTVPSATQLNDILRLAPIRNRVVHAGIRPPTDAVKRVVTLASGAMWRFLRLAEIVYKPHLDAANNIHQAFVTKHNLP